MHPHQTRSSATPPDVPQDVPPDVHADHERHREILRQMLEIGFRHVQATDPAQTAQADPKPDPKPNPAAAANTYNQLSRSVRLTIMLAEQLTTPKTPRPDPHARTAARKHIIRAVEDTIRERVAKAERPAAEAELHERMDGPDIEFDIARRPPFDIFKDLCRDLNITPLPGLGQWKRRTPPVARDLFATAAQPPAPPDTPPDTPPPPAPPPDAPPPETQLPGIPYPPRYDTLPNPALSPAPTVDDGLSEGMRLARDIVARYPPPGPDPP